MNKKLIFGASCLGLTLVLSACGTATNTSTGTNTSGNTQNNNGGEARPDRRPDFGQPNTPPEVRGLVKTIVGNEVDVLKIEQPQRATSTEATTATSTKKNSLSLGGTNPEGQGGGFRGMGGARPGEGSTSTTDRAAMLAKIKEMSSGEEKVTIPVGIKMLKMSTDGSRTMVEATLADITTDKMITIWLNNTITDKKVASFVLIN